MRVKIASRKSCLARLQAESVAQTLRKRFPQIHIEFDFRSSLGDRHSKDPLWQMPEKGVFTQDFHEALCRREVDMVVHSWKDLPLEENLETSVVATLERADQRDLLLLPKKGKGMENLKNLKHLHVLTSSPRRAYNLADFLPKAFPGSIQNLSFLPLRGNIETRIQKLLEKKETEGEMEGETASAMLVAKAAVDRILQSQTDAHRKMRDFLIRSLQKCYFMILPLSHNPTAAGQGALAIETRRDHDELNEMLSQINHPEDFHTVQKERQRLQKHGGGCHQKVGISILKRPYGEVLFEKGELPNSGGKFHHQTLLNIESESEKQGTWPEATCLQDIFPSSKAEGGFFERKTLSDGKIRVPTNFKTARAFWGLWISRANALSKELWKELLSLKAEEQNNSQAQELFIWTAGVHSWFKLAQRGLWVHGCADGLGEKESPRLDHLFPNKQAQDAQDAQEAQALHFIKLTHENAVAHEDRHEVHEDADTHQDAIAKRDFSVLPTYKLIKRKAPPSLQGKTHFYWMSGSSFLAAQQQDPQIAEKGYHACGPGHTLGVLKKAISDRQKLKVFVSYEDWKNQILCNKGK